MTHDPTNQPYDPYAAPPVFDSQPATGGYYESGYPDQPQYPDQYTQQSPPYQPTPQPQYSAPMYAAPAPYLPPQNGVGIAALILGILGLVACGLFTSVPGIICGHIGVKKADRGEADNRGMAMAGMIMGYIGTGLWLLAVIFYIIIVVIAFNSTSSYSY